MDYSAFRFRAVVDWLEVRVNLSRPTQPQHVRARIAQKLPHWGTAPYVRAETEASSRSARSFTLRVQDPRGPDAFMSDIREIARPGDPTITEADITIIGIEVALDAYHLDQDRDALVGLAHHFHSHHARPPAGPSRVTGPEGYGEVESNPTGFRRALADGYTINAGDRDGEYRARYYVKEHDTRDTGRYAPLPVDQRRARMEVTLAGSLVPFVTVEGWRKFPFEKLARRLTLRQAIAPSTPMGKLLQTRAPRIGSPDDETVRQSHKRQHRVNTRADNAAYGKARDALRGLTRDQQGKKPRRRQPPPHADPPGWGDW